MRRAPRPEDLQRVARLGSGVRHRQDRPPPGSGSGGGPRTCPRPRAPGSGRCRRRPWTSVTGPSRSSSTSTRWQPKSAMGPPPDSAPAHQPRARVIGAGVEGLEGLGVGQHRLADLARRQELAEAGDHGVVVTVVRDAQPHAVGSGGRDHALASGRVEGHRLLAENVLAGLRGSDRLLGVQVHRRRQVDGVDLGVLQHVTPVGVPANRRRGAPRTPRPAPRGHGPR